MRINSSVLAVGLTLWLSSFVPLVVAQSQPQAERKSVPKAAPKAASPAEIAASQPAQEVTKAPAGKASTLSKEFKVLSVDALSALDSLSKVYDLEGIVYQSQASKTYQFVNRAKYLAESDQEKALYPLLRRYLDQIEGCRIKAQPTNDDRMLNHEQRFERLEKLAVDCAQKNHEVSAAIESYIVSGGSKSN